MRTLPLLAMLAVALSGCLGGSAPPAPQAPVSGALAFEPMLVTLTPAEPGEPAGHVHVRWSGDRFGGGSDNRSEFVRAAVVTPQGVFLTNTGMGWVRRTADDGRGATLLAQLAAWNLRALLADPATHTTRTATRLDARGNVSLAGVRVPVQATLTLDGARITDARIVAPTAREGPFHLEPEPAGPPLPQPGEPRDAGEVDAKDARAQDAHAFVIGLLLSYARNHAGLLPDQVSPDSLRVELLASGKSWPTNIYTGQALEAKESHGAFRWVKCQPNVAAYVGYGWDGFLTEQRWGGQACPQASPASSFMWSEAQ